MLLAGTLGLSLMLSSIHFKVVLNAEFGRFVFGDAFKNADQTTPSPINAARFYVRSTL